MRRLVIGAALIGGGVLAVRALAPKLHARLVARCERMFEHMPDTFPPKRMLRGIEEIRTTSALTLALLEAREQAPKAESRDAASTGPRQGGSAATRQRERVAVGARGGERDRRLDA